MDLAKEYQDRVVSKENTEGIYVRGSEKFLIEELKHFPKTMHALIKEFASNYFEWFEFELKGTKNHIELFYEGTLYPEITINEWNYDFDNFINENLII